MKSYGLLLLAFLVTACSLGNGNDDTQSAESPPAPAPPSQEEPHAQEPAPTPQDPLALEPTMPPPLVAEEAPLMPESPQPTWEEVDPTLTPEKEEETRDLLGHFTSLYGLLLPRSNSRLALEAVIGPRDHTFPLRRLDGNVGFAREVIIGVTKKAIYVNDFRVADIVCATTDGHPCPPAFEGDSNQQRYRVKQSALTADGPDAHIIEGLLHHLEEVQRTRRTVLASVSDEAAEWLLDCDVFTLAVDRQIPYLVLAQVLHTAAYTDLTRARLVTLDDADTLTYIPLLSPRLDRYQKKITHIVGDSWWQEETRARSEEYRVAYLGYAASVHADTFASMAADSLPSCLPLNLAWDKVAQDPEYARMVKDRIHEHIGAVRTSHGRLLGLAPAPPIPDAETHGAVIPLPTEDSNGEEVPPTPSGDIHTQPADVVSGAPAGLPRMPSRLASLAAVPARAAAAAGPDAVPDVVDDATPPPLAGKVSLRPILYVAKDHYTLALKAATGELMEAVRIPFREADRLYEYLEATLGWVLSVGAAFDVSTGQFVQALDTVRYRCAVRSMSNKCKRWNPVHPQVYLFLAPGDQFGLRRHEEAPPDEEELPEPVAPATGGEPPAADGGPAAVETGEAPARPTLAPVPPEDDGPSTAPTPLLP